MADLGYVYNRAATAVRSGRSDLLGLLVTDIRNPIFAELMMSVDRCVERTQTSTILGFSFDSRERQARIARSLVEHMVGGLLLLPTADTIADDLACVKDLPVVQLLREVPGLPSDVVGVDNLGSGTSLGEHLAAVGVGRALLVGGERASQQFEERLQGLRVSVDTAPVLGGAVGLEARLGEGPDCVVTYNDTHLLAVLHTLRDRGLEPGVDVRVASFDDTPIARGVKPSITSVDHHAGTIAERAVELLNERIADPERPWRRVTVPGELVVRESTRVVPPCFAP